MLYVNPFANLLLLLTLLFVIVLFLADINYLKGSVSTLKADYANTVKQCKLL